MWVIVASMVYKLFDKNTASGAVKNEIIQNKKLVEELNKPLPFIDNIWGTALAPMHLISKFNKITCFLLSAIYIFSK